jgi:hypothetical protein
MTEESISIEIVVPQQADSKTELNPFRFVTEELKLYHAGELISQGNAERSALELWQLSDRLADLFPNNESAEDASKRLVSLAKRAYQISIELTSIESDMLKEDKRIKDLAMDLEDALFARD